VWSVGTGFSRWLVWRSGAYSPHRPKAVGIWPVAPCRGGGLAPRVMLGIGLRMWYSASPSMLSPFSYIYACLSLSLLFRQSLLYDSQFNISIRTRLISTWPAYGAPYSRNQSSECDSPISWVKLPTGDYNSSGRSGNISLNYSLAAKRIFTSCIRPRRLIRGVGASNAHT